MSLILEALKKAERQHRLGEVPGIGSTQTLKTPSQSHWSILLLLALIVLAMLGLGLYLGIRDFRGHDAGLTAVTPVPEQAAPPSVHQSPPVASPPQARPPQLPQQISDSQVMEKPVEPDAIETLRPARPQAPDATYTVEEPAPAPPPAPKTLQQLPDGFVENLPVLNIDIHSYDTRASHRYVLINLEKYREGDYLAEGPLLSEILSDGVILEHMGERFILPIGNR